MENNAIYWKWIQEDILDKIKDIENWKTINHISDIDFAKLKTKFLYPDKENNNEWWVCPKCWSVYSPMLFECRTCNQIVKPRLTSTQYNLLKLYNDFVRTKWYNPTYRDLADILKINPSAVFETLKRIKKKWFIE